MLSNQDVDCNSLDIVVPRFLKGKHIEENYYQSPNPYEAPSFCNVNLREMARYARTQDKKLVELTEEEDDKFKR